MKKTTPSNVGISAATMTEKGLRLLPNNRLMPPFVGVSQQHSLRSKIGAGVNFFYKVLNGDQLVETGIAELNQNGKIYYLNREFAFKVFEDNHLIRSGTNKPTQLEFDLVYTVQSYIPNNYKDALASPNSVLCTSDAFCPMPVELGENSVLGRIEGGLVQSIKIDDLTSRISDTFVGDFLDSIRDTKNPLILSTNQLELMGKNSRISCNQLWIKPLSSVPKRRTAGFIFYSEKENCLKFYDGTKWRKLVSE